MKINLHIDQIVIEGATLTRRQRDQLAGAVTQELISQLRQRLAGPRPGPTIATRQRPGPLSAPAVLGADIARQVLAALPLDSLAGRPARLPVRVTPSTGAGR